MDLHLSQEFNFEKFFLQFQVAFKNLQIPVQIYNTPTITGMRTAIYSRLSSALHK